MVPYVYKYLKFKANREKFICHCGKLIMSAVNNLWPPKPYDDMEK